jgi:hypothetical protein
MSYFITLPFLKAYTLSFASKEYAPPDPKDPNILIAKSWTPAGFFLKQNR